MRPLASDLFATWGVPDEVLVSDLIHTVMRYLVFPLLAFSLAACSVRQAPTPEATIQATAADGVAIYGETYFGSLGADAPLVLLFHQAGSNGRGEYAEIAAWLNSEGYRALAWDQRSGGDLFGASNRSALGLPSGVEPGFCDAYPDLVAALDEVMRQGLAERVVVWGSSYSADIVFRLAAERPDAIAGVAAFSPASGGPMVDCRARTWAPEVRAPMAVFRPASEMERESSVEQRGILEAAGAEFFVVTDGVHGSSMLVDARTDHDMSDARGRVLDWLGRVTNPLR